MPPSEPNEPTTSSDGPVTIVSGLSVAEAHTIQATLEAAEIQVFLLDAHTVAANPLYEGVVGGAKIAVSAENEKRARSILAEAEKEYDNARSSEAEIRERRPALRLFAMGIGAFFGGVCGLFGGVLLAQTSRPLGFMVFLAGIVIGARLGRRPRYHCSDSVCMVALDPEMTVCPGCGARIVNRS